MTKFARLADGRILSFPDETTDEVMDSVVQRAIQNPESTKTTEELEKVPAAPSTFKDVSEFGALSLAGGIKGLTDLFGVGNVASKKMEELQRDAFKRLSPERQRELAIEEELARRAAEEGTLAEIKQAGKSFLRSPLQQGVGAAFSSLPIIAATALAPQVSVPAALAGRAGLGAAAARTAITNAPGIAVGAGMGVGSQKGQDYERVKQAMLERGATEEEAEAAGQRAAEYSLQNAARQAASGVAGGAEAALGVESLIGRAGRARVGAKGGPEAPTFGGALAQSTLGETIPEAIQSGVAGVGSNIALQQAGIDTDLFKGVAGEVTSGALAAALLGSAVSPLQMRQLQQEFARDQQQKQLEELKKAQAEYEKQQAQISKTKEELGTQQGLALPAPAPKVEEQDPLFNPLGNFSKEELGSRLSKIEDYRQKNGLPLLNSYSIEDVVDAMPEEDLNPLIEYKIRPGYQEVKYSPQDVLNAATDKVDTTTQGFRDFLNRTTGNSDLNTMSQAQLFAAFNALESLPAGQGVTILPEGSNASRFTEIQMLQGLESIHRELQKNNALTPEQTITKVKEATGLKNDRDAASLIKQLVKDNNLDTNADGNITAPTEISNLPAGYELQKGTFKQGEQQMYGVIDKDAPLEGVDTYTSLDQAQEKADSLNKVRKQQYQMMQQRIQNQQDEIDKSQLELDAMEAAGEGGTNEYKQAKAKHDALVEKNSRAINTLSGNLGVFERTLTAGPVGMKQVNRTGFTLFKDGVPVSTHPTADAAMDSLVGTLPDAEVEALAQDKTPGMRTVARKARQRIEQKNQPAKTEKKPVVTEEAPTPEVTEQEFEEAKTLAETLAPILKKFGLGDIQLQIIKGMENEGSYTANLIRIAMDLKDPIGVLRHESIHALKDLGFFTDKQWESLVRMANDKWVDQYLRNVRHDETRSRFDAYKEQFEDEAKAKGLTGKDADNYIQNALIEEAIADAFRAFGKKPPPGMLTAIINKIKQFFQRLKEALNVAGYETAEDIFGKIEAGQLKPSKQAAEQETKKSLSGIGVPMSTRGLMERQTTVAQQDLGLNTEAKRGRFNNVREIATALNQYTVDNIGRMDRNNLTSKDSTDIAKAIADEVAYQLGTSAKTGTGLGWYSSNYPNAVKRLAKRFPELGTDPHARSVFSAIVAVTSNGEKVTKNIDNAIKLYSDLRDGKPLVAMGNRRATALENNLATIEMLLDKYERDFENVLLKEITVKEMNARLREMGEETDGSYLKDTVVPAAAVYFGPKLGAFYANLSGSEGYLTMDLWWTRSINRMRGLLMPQATEASINKFRDMMDRPNATRDEVVAATIPLRNKYEEYGWNTELEYLVGAKEPAKKAQKADWFKKAEEVAGDAYEQLLFDHNAEKMANTIYKNEFEMLEEAPFTATDRKFMYDAARKAQDMLRKENIDLTLADIQAALWYYEKRLYEKLSGSKADDIGYEEAIIAQADQGNGRARPSVVFTQQPSGGAKPTATSEEAGRAGAEPTGGAEEVTAKKSLRAPDTKEFNDWFSDSKAVDKEGRPMVMYHGTARDISEFKPGVANAIFVSPDPEVGSIYSADSLKWVSENAADELTAEQKAQAIDDAVALVQEEYSFLSDPEERKQPDYKKMVARRDDAIKDIKKNAFTKKALDEKHLPFLAQAVRDYLPVGENIVPVFVRALNPFDYENKKHLDMVINQVLNFMPESVTTKMEFPEKYLAGLKGLLSRGLYNKIEDDAVQKAIRSLGFDSFYVKEHGVKNLGVYSPVQLKSATGNVGAYDINNPDIRKSLRPKIDAATQARINETIGKRDDKSWLERLMTAIAPQGVAGFRQAYINRYETIGRKERMIAKMKGLPKIMADVSAESAALFSDYAAQLSASAFGVNDGIGGIPVYQNGITKIWNDNGKIKGPIAIFKPLAELRDPEVFRDWQFWMSAKRGSRLELDGREKLFTQADLDMANKRAAQYPEGLFESVRKEWDTYNRGLVEYMIKTGVVNKQMGESWMKHGDYFPFYRQQMDDDAKGPKVFSAISGVKAPKALKGGDVTVGDFFENVVRNTQSAIEAGMKNIAAERSIQNELFLKSAVESVGFKGEPKRPSSMTNVVTVLRNGQMHYYECEDIMFVEAMKGLNMAEIPGLQLFAAPANLLRSFVTKTPDFILANLLRDSMAAWVTSGAKITPIIDTAKGFGAALAGKDKDLQTLYNAGLIGGQEFTGKVRETGKTLEKQLRKAAGAKTTKEKVLRPFTSVWEALEKGSAASDAATRLAVYKDTYAQTGNEAEALFRAMEIMNFQRKGSSALIRILTAVTPFLNARIQGLDVLYRAGIKPFTKTEDKTAYDQAIAKSFIRRGLSLMALSGLYYALMHDDEDYLAQEEETRDNNWLIPALGVKIPIPFEVGVIFKVMPERILAYIMGNDTGEQLLASVQRNLYSTFGIQLPQAVLPMIEVATNYSFFTGRPIIGQGMEDVDKEFQVDPGTSKFAEILGQFTSFKTETGKSFGLSPIQIDHLIKGYTGTLGTYAVDAMDTVIGLNSEIPKPSKRFEQMPFIRRFALDPEARGNVTAYYELKNAVDQAVRTSNLLERTGKVEDLAEYQLDNMPLLASKDYVNALYKNLKEFNDMKRFIRSSTMDADEKRDALLAIGQSEAALVSQIKEYRKMIAE